MRDLRLRALTDAPDAFGSRLEDERELGRDGWVEWIEGWRGSTNVLFVAELADREDRWVGMAVGSRPTDDDEARLYGMWVDPGWRGQGIGARLVDEVLAWARSWDAARVVLAVTETNERARAFYEGLGFADSGRRQPLRDGSELTVRTMMSRGL